MRPAAVAGDGGAAAGGASLRPSGGAGPMGSRRKDPSAASTEGLGTLRSRTAQGRGDVSGDGPAIWEGRGKGW